MEKLQSIYRGIHMKTKKGKVIAATESILLISYIVYKCIWNHSADASDITWYNMSVIILQVGLVVFLMRGSTEGMPEGMELWNMLDFYPVDLRKIYPLQIVDIAIFTVIHMVVSLLATTVISGGYEKYMVIAAVEIAAALYTILCCHIGLGRIIKCEKEEEYSMGTVAGVCIVLSPLLIMVIACLYGILL